MFVMPKDRYTSGSLYERFAIYRVLHTKVLFYTSASLYLGLQGKLVGNSAWYQDSIAEEKEFV